MTNKWEKLVIILEAEEENPLKAKPKEIEDAARKAFL